MNLGIRAELIDTVRAGNTLGESAAWDPVEERLWWTDIQERRLFRYDPRSASLATYELPERLGSFGFVDGGERLIAAFESGFALYHPPSARIEWIARPAHGAPNVRFNDGRVDRQGRFWAGSMTEGGGAPLGKLYCLDGRDARVHLTDIAICNSICFSPDGRHLYFADTPQRAILAFELDGPGGVLSNRRVFARTPEGAFPDGANVDADGHLWSAHWGAGRIVRYAPDGRISGEIEIPASQPTCVAFGGRDLDLLFVTSAREGLGAATLQTQRHAGDLFVYSVNVRGLADRAFAAPR
jgi:sugar lactone lactonase YvrE